MKYLLYYKLDSNFIADQTSVGGDGTKVVSVVDGVAWTNDQEKAYYRFANNDSENLTSYTVTVHYKSRSNKTLAPDDVYAVDAYVGKSVKETIIAKGISGYTALNNSEELIINDNTEYTFFYKSIPDYKKPLTFNIISAGTINWKTNNPAYTNSIEYKKNDGEWITITSNTGTSAPSISVSAGDVVQFRGNNTTYNSGGSRYSTFSGTTAKFKVEGNIMSLIDSENFATATILVSSYTFSYLFYQCTGLTSAVNLVLPATTLAHSCYESMFDTCRSLTTTPELPATTLADFCYQGMFYNCTSLTIAPELPATTLVSGCYRSMFYGCTSLNYIKCLATDISASNCTNYWVNNVSSTGTFVKDANMANWVSGPSGIPSKWSIKDYGFKLSRSNITLSEITSAKTITITSSFNSWTATTNDDWYGLSQYTGGTGDTTITITANTQNTNRTGTVTFTDGTNVATLTVNEKYLIETPLTFNIISSGTIYWKAYSTKYTISVQYKKNDGGWTSIASNTGTSAPTISVNAGDVVQFRGDNATYATGTSMYNTFSGTTARFEVEGNTMSLIDSTNFATAATLASNYTFYRLFYQCAGLTSAENLVLPATTLVYQCYSNMFYGCTSLTTTPSVLPATTLASYCYYQMFWNCTSLTTAPALPATTLTNYCYNNMFDGCSSLTKAPELPATTLANSCYGNMFWNCTSLTTAPELPATTLASSCYSGMFYGCTSLNYIKCLATDISASYCTNYWVSNVSSSGTFVKNPNMSSWTTGVNGIPTNWTIQDNV